MNPMHVEMPKKGALASARAFAGEYTMIVVSILTALALEHAAQSWHHSHRAHEAQVNIEAEIRANLEQVRTSMRKNEQELANLKSMREALQKGIVDKVNGEQLVSLMNEAGKGKFGIHQSIPTLRREAWEVAVASQSVSWMKPALLQRYASVYSLQRDFSRDTISAVQLVLDAPALINRSIDVGFGKVDGTGIYYSVAQLQASLRATQSSLGEMEKELVRALPKD
jgi:hypothetical protein